MRRHTAPALPRLLLSLTLAASIGAAALPVPARADDDATAEAAAQEAAEQNSYDLGYAVNAGLDTGYSESNTIGEDDPHFGWSLGQFSISGFTSVKRDGSTPTFLKTSGDTIRLGFRLDQDIDCLNGNEALSIADDTDGYDEAFGVEKSDPGFGRGTLIIRQTNYQNTKSKPQVYNDYLTGVVVGADTEVDVFEEGDYEVALDYEVKDDPRKVPLLGWSVLPGYTNYTIRFKFSVRNGNTMVFLMDAVTGSELTNSSTTKNGFTIDMARSRYLDINVKRENLASNGEDLVEDTRFNGPAKDGERYTEPGIYTITATNPTTGQTTEKKIYVGDDQVMEAFVTTGYSLDEIRSMIDQGAQIADDGTITWPEVATAAEETTTEASVSTSDETVTPTASTTAQTDKGGVPVIPIVIVLVAAAAVVLLLLRKKGLGIATDRPKDSPGVKVIDMDVVDEGGSPELGGTQGARRIEATDKDAPTDSSSNDDGSRRDDR